MIATVGTNEWYAERKRARDERIARALGSANHDMMSVNQVKKLLAETSDPGLRIDCLQWLGRW